LINVLVSVPYVGGSVRKALGENRQHIRLLIDSGAFTNWKAGKETTVESYMEFLDGLPVKPWRYFALDKIGDPEGTWDNYQKMLNAGYNPIPIFTRGAPVADLDRYYETSDVVGIGGLVATRKSRGYLKYIVERNKGRPMHWLGVTDPQFIYHYKPYSCDSSSWSNAPRYGELPIYIGAGKFLRWDKKIHAIYKPTSQVWKAIRSYGYDPKVFQEEKNWRGLHGYTRKLSIASHVRYYKDAERQFGTKMFLVAEGHGFCINEFVRCYLRDEKYLWNKTKEEIAV